MLRSRRAISWIAYAEEETRRGRYHTAFCFYWIAFNACYGSDPSRDEKSEYESYFEEIERHDKEKTICRYILYEIDRDVEDLVKCRFAYDGFWRDGHRTLSDAKWRRSLQREVDRFSELVIGGMDMNTVEVLSIVFDRIYCVRNQVIHGCTTRERSTGDDQIRLGSTILDRLVPVFVRLMLGNRHTGRWRPPYYPGEKLVRSDNGKYVLESGSPWRDP